MILIRVQKVKCPHGLSLLNCFHSLYTLRPSSVAQEKPIFPVYLKRTYILLSGGMSCLCVLGSLGLKREF